MKAEESLRVRAEEARRQSEENYRALVEAIDDAIEIRDASGRYIEANSEFLRRVGLTRDQVLGRTPHEVYSAEHADSVIQADRRVLESGEAIDVEHSLPGGERGKLYQVRRAPIRDPEGRIVGTISVSRDITERRRLEEQLRRAQRLEAAGRVAGQVADDFNNLLAPVVAFAELLKTELPAGHPGSRYCDMMLTAAQRMADISQDLLPLGRRGVTVAKPVDMNEVVRQVERELRDQLQSLSVATHLAPDLLPVNGSQVQLHRMVTNLVANACDAMEGVGVLTLKTELYYVDRQFGRYNRVEMGEYAKLTVSDTGCGIPQHIRDKVFDAFFTTKYADKRRGAGLGLSVVQAIVDDHRGYLDLSTEPGKGTAFYVYLPVSRDEAGGLSLADIPLGKETILVADDDPIQREVANQLLGRLGYRVAAVSSGEKALTYLADHEADLLILDMIMPRGIDGVETYKRAKQIRPDQKAIVLYGFAESSRVQEAQELGSGICLRKPVRLEELARVVRRELDRQ